MAKAKVRTSAVNDPQTREMKFNIFNRLISSNVGVDSSRLLIEAEKVYWWIVEGIVPTTAKTTPKRKGA